MNKLIYRFFLIIGFSTLCFSNSVDDVELQRTSLHSLEYKIALDNFRNKNYEASYEQFSTLFLNDMGNILINFYLGRSAYETKRYDMALSAYDRILISEPNNNRVRLEVAQTYMMMKMYTQSIAEFELALESKLPSLVRKRVEANIKMMKSKQKKHFFNITALLGLIYDSNINATPEAGAFDIYSPSLNATVTLNNNGEEEGATIVQFATIASYKYKIEDNLFINSTITPMMLKYINHKEKDLHALSLSFTPTLYQKSDKYEFGFIYDHIYLGHKGYQKNFYVKPKYSKVLDKKLLFESSLKAGRINYISESEKDANSLQLENRLKYSSENAGLFSFGLDLGKDIEINDSRTDISKDFYGVSLSNSYDFLDGYSVKTSISYKNILYRDKDINFLSRREDKKSDYSISLQKMLMDNSLINIGSTFTNNTSNHESFDYDKYTLNLNFIYSF